MVIGIKAKSAMEITGIVTLRDLSRLLPPNPAPNRPRDLGL
jgi:hypothetical protein